MGNVKKLLTLEQLAKFCEDNNFLTFNSKDSGYTLSVQVPGNLVFEEEKKDESLMYVKVKVCHTLLNRNKSFISEDNMKKAMPTLKYKPLLASIIEDANGELDFNGHDMNIVEDEDGNTAIEYIEKQIGAFTNDDPYLEYDEENDKTYVIATAAIPRDYTKAAEIIERKNGTKVSCELQISNMAYNAKEKYLELLDFIFTGVACLGESVKEGMAGSRLDIADFTTQNNSLKYEEDTNLIEVMTKLTEALNNNIKAYAENTSRKEDNPVADVELKKENAEVAEEVVVVEETSDETQPTEEVTEVESTEETEVTPEEVESVDENMEAQEEETPSEKFSIKFAMTDGDNTKEFSLSLTDKLYAMNSLVNETYGELDNDYYDVNVYEEEKYVEMYGWFTGKAYRQSFKVKKDSYQLVGDRIEVYCKYLSDDEIKALDKMKTDYAALQATYEEKATLLEKYESEPSKMEILNSTKYSYVADTKEFDELRNNHFDLSIDEVTSKANEILLSYAESGSLKFSTDETHKENFKQIPYVNTEKKTGRYGNLFSK